MKVKLKQARQTEMVRSSTTTKTISMKGVSNQIYLTVMGFKNGEIKQFMRASFVTESNKEVENTHKEMNLNILESLATIILTIMVGSPSALEILIKECGKKVWWMDMEFIDGWMEQFIKVSLPMALRTVEEHTEIHTVQFSKEAGKKVKDMGKGHCKYQASKI